MPRRRPSAPFALQLCVLRAYGRFLDDYRQAPIKIVNHLSRQLGLAPVLFLDRPAVRRPSVISHSVSAAISACAASTGRPRTDLREWLRGGAIEGRTAAELLIRAEDKLANLRVMLPAVSTLERMVAAVDPRHDRAVRYGRQPIAGALRTAIDLLVEVPEGDARSSLFRLKDYPKSANAAVIKGDIVRLHLIEELLGTGAGAGRVSIHRSSANSANSDAAMMRAISAASPSPSVTHWLPAIWWRPARRCSIRSSR